MQGAWLVRIGRWFFRKETFERMVGPAIADMQAEASFGSLHRWKHYFAIGVLLIHALLRDLRLDVFSAFDAEARRFVWKRTAIWYAGFVALLTILGVEFNLPPDLPMQGIWSAALTSAGLEAVVSAVGLAMAAAVFYLWRRSSRRSVVPAVLTIATLTIVFALTVRPVRMSADRILYNSIQAERSSSGSPNFRYKEVALDVQITWWQDIQSGVSVIPSALIGIVLARRRGLQVAATVIRIYASWLIVVIAFFWLGSHHSPSLVMQRWRDIFVNAFVGILWLAADRFWRRARQPAAEV